MSTTRSALALHRLEQLAAPARWRRARSGCRRRAGAGAGVLLVAADEHVGGGLEEQHPDPMASRPQPPERPRGSSAWWVPLPTTRASATDARPRRAAELGDLRDERAAGRLSMTNQPRSSRSSAACGAPGAGQPGDDDELGHGQPCGLGHAPSYRRDPRPTGVAASGAFGDEQQEARDGRGLGVLARPGRGSPAAAPAPPCGG